MTLFGDLSESEATGQIAEIFAEIRYFGAVPYVSSLQRQLATVPGCLECATSGTGNRSWCRFAQEPVFSKKCDILDNLVPQNIEL